MDFIKVYATYAFTKSFWRQYIIKQPDVGSCHSGIFQHPKRKGDEKMKKIRRVLLTLAEEVLLLKREGALEEAFELIAEAE